MDALRDVSIAGFLPLTRMRALAASRAQAYRRAQPFPHIVVDDFFDATLLDRVVAEFPAPEQIRWRGYNNAYESKKLFASADEDFGPVTRLLLYHLNSLTFIDFLSALTGIENLISDPHFSGGGMHQVVRGGRLGIHADFNHHKHYGLDRRLNLLVYLNKNWREEYGGHLELWTRDMTTCKVRVLPLFNRMVLFNTTDFSYHGHPDPLQCPEGVTRKSLALYYYTNGRPAEEISGRQHSTLFRARHPGEFAPPSLLQRLRRLFIASSDKG